MSLDTNRSHKNNSAQAHKRKKRGLIIGICVEAFLLLVLVVGYIGISYAEKIWNIVEKPTDSEMIYNLDPWGQDNRYIVDTDENGNEIRINPNASVAVETPFQTEAPTQGAEPGTLSPVTPTDPTEPTQAPTAPPPDYQPTERTGFKTFVVFGVDARNTTTLLSGTQCDVCMIISVDQGTGEIRLVSVYRDFYLWNGTDENGQNVFRKLTDTYRRMGAEQMVSLLNRNLDLEIEDFVTVNWQAVADCIDMMGGLDVEMTEKEVQGANSCLWETAFAAGKIEDWEEVEYIPEYAGVHHLNGAQTVAFGRIRYGVGDDYGRTLRQRTVVKLVLQKAKTLSLSQINQIVYKVAGEVATSFDILEILNLAGKVMSFNIAGSQGFPLQRKADNYIYADTLVSNVTQLYEGLYNTYGYKPSSTVEAIGQGHINRIKERGLG